MVTITSIIYSQAMYVSDNNNYFGISCLYSSESDPTGSESFTGANLNYILDIHQIFLLQLSCCLILFWYQI